MQHEKQVYLSLLISFCYFYPFKMVSFPYRSVQYNNPTITKCSPLRCCYKKLGGTLGTLWRIVYICPKYP